MLVGTPVGTAIVPWGRNRELVLGKQVGYGDTTTVIDQLNEQVTAGHNTLVVEKNGERSRGYQLNVRERQGMFSRKTNLRAFVAGAHGESGYRLVEPFNRAFVHTAGGKAAASGARMVRYQAADTRPRGLVSALGASKGKLAAGAAVVLALGGAGLVGTGEYREHQNRTPSANDVLDAVQAPRVDGAVSGQIGDAPVARVADYYALNYGGDDLVIDPAKGEAQRSVEFDFNGRRYRARLDLTDTARLAAKRLDADGKAERGELSEVISDSGFARINNFLEAGGERVVPGSIKRIR